MTGSILHTFNRIAGKSILAVDKEEARQYRYTHERHLLVNPDLVA